MRQLVACVAVLSVLSPQMSYGAAPDTTAESHVAVDDERLPVSETQGYCHHESEEPEDHALLLANYFKRLHRPSISLAGWHAVSHVSASSSPWYSPSRATAVSIVRVRPHRQDVKYRIHLE